MGNTTYIHIMEQHGTSDTYTELLCIEKQDGFTNNVMDTLQDIITTLVIHQADLHCIISKPNHKSELVDYIGMTLHRVRGSGLTRDLGGKPVNLLPAGLDVNDLIDGRIAHTKFEIVSKQHLLQNRLYNLATLVQPTTIWDSTEVMYDYKIRIPRPEEKARVCIHIKNDGSITINLVRGLFKNGYITTPDPKVLVVPELGKFFEKIITFSTWMDLYEIWRKKVKYKYKAIASSNPAEHGMAIWEI